MATEYELGLVSSLLTGDSMRRRISFSAGQIKLWEQSVICRRGSDALQYEVRNIGGKTQIVFQLPDLDPCH